MRRVLLAVFVPGILAAAPVTDAPDCMAFLKDTREWLGQDSMMLSQARDKLARAEELCRAGKADEAVALLQAVRDSWMPMGTGN